MEVGKSVFTVLEKLGRNSFWKDEDVGALKGNVPGDCQVYCEPAAMTGNNSGSHFLIIVGKMEKSRLVALLGHRAFSLDLRRRENLPFNINSGKKA